MVDTWSEFKLEFERTWHRRVEVQVQSSRIDRIYINEGLLPSLHDIKLLCPTTRISGHLPMMIELNPQANNRFKLNSRLLSIDHVLETTKKILHETLDDMRQHGANIMAKCLGDFVMFCPEASAKYLNSGYLYFASCKELDRSPLNIHALSRISMPNKF